MAKSTNPTAKARKPAYWARATRQLRANDPALAGIIDHLRGAALVPRADAFFSLARSIVGQQISVTAAEAIWQRVCAATGAVAPAAFDRLPEPDLNACGLSRQKTRYLKSLAEGFLNGSLPVDQWHGLDDEAVIDQLCTVKGIGRWTAEMFLIFHLTRPDVLPLADIGLRRAMSDLYAAGETLDPPAMSAIAETWRPWRSVAVWYLWRSLDVIPVEY